MIKGIIFDMDGVLVDSEPAITYAAMEVLRRLGCTAEEEEFRPYRGTGDDNFIGSVLRNHGGVYKPEYKAEAYRIYIDSAREKVKVYSWSGPLLLTLGGMEFRLAVASASDIEKVSCNLSCIGVPDALFSAVVTGSDITRNKPAPDIFLKAAEKMALDPSLCLVVEDSVAGIRAAKAAGMTAVGVTTSFPRETLLSVGADYVTDDLAELPALLSSL